MLSTVRGEFGKIVVLLHPMLGDNCWYNIFIRITEGETQPSTSKVLAMSAIMPRLVGMDSLVTLRVVDIVSDCESHSRPSALGCGDECKPVRPLTGSFSLRLDSIDWVTA